MTTIAIPDEVYQSLAELAAERNLTPEQYLVELIAQEQWEEHAASAYDAYHARNDNPQERLNEEEFLTSLRGTDANL